MTASSMEQTAARTWQGTSVDVAAIEAAIARLWREEGQHEAADRRQPPVRTSVLNLIVYVSHEDDVARAVEAIGGLADRHPSRLICVAADPTAPASSLDAEVTTQCGGAGAYDRLCWEQISIKAHGASAAHAPGVVIPLLLPELPTYLWWTGDVPFGTELFSRIVALCDRLIVDSALFARPIDSLGKLAAINHAHSADRGVSDFHWMRLTPWRNLTAQFFDPAAFRPYVQRIESVRISYARDARAKGNATQALLLAGWLASRLGWTARPQGARLKDDTLHLEAERTDATVAIKVEPREPAGAADGDLISLTITAALRDTPGVFSIERRAQDAEATTTTTIDGAPGVAHTVRMATRGAGGLLREELEIFRHDQIYEEALHAAAALCERLATEEGS